MPEGKTTVGENTTYDFLQCNGSYCSEKVIELEAPISQVLLLAEKSPECIQTVRFDCQSAKVSVSSIALVHDMDSRIQKLKIFCFQTFYPKF